uniref:Uncharacterized protein n=1 Tax=Arundo donax TaxID=35708 RepID=A0A0A9GLQ2_ARUDO
MGSGLGFSTCSKCSQFIWIKMQMSRRLFVNQCSPKVYRCLYLQQLFLYSID